MTFPCQGDADRFNPNHAPAGSAAGGQFAPASGSSGGKAPAKDTRATPSSQKPVGEGEKGKRVSDLQSRLNALGAKPPLKTDGVFGPATLAAVKAFQKEHGLKPDGLVGPETTAALRARPGKPAVKTPAAKKAPAKLSAHQAHVAHKKHAAHEHAAHVAHLKHLAATGKATAAQKAELAKATATRAQQIAWGPDPDGTWRALGHEKVGHTGQGLWHHKGMQLPAYIQHVANDLISERGIPESQAVQMAVGLIQDWAKGGKDVKPDTRAKAAAALAEWERLRAQSHAMTAAKRATMSDGTADRAVLAAADINNLPDSAFAYIKPGGTKDSSGRTVPRSLRYLPIPDAAHIRNALARLPQSDLTPDQKAQAMTKIRAAAKKAGVEMSGSSDSNDNTPAASRGEIRRDCQLEDIHIVSRAGGDGSGRLVEAYAAVFGQPAVIHDHQGHYEEEIDRSAFDARLAQISRSPRGLASALRVLYNHGRTAEGDPAPEFQKPLGRPVEVRAESRGLLTRTEYAKTPHAEEVLELIRAGAITTQSFVGGIIRSDPELRGPGDKYRARNGVLTRVRRLSLGLREYGPVLWEAYSGAEILGVRMALPADGDTAAESSDFDPPAADEYGSANEEPDTGGVPEETRTARHHQHDLYVLRARELREKKGLVW